MSTLDTAAYWNQLAGITEAARLVRFPESDGNEATAVVQRRWQNREGVQVRLYTLEGSGHVVPSKTVQFARIVGPAAGDLAGPKEILAFFRDVERSTGRRPSTGD
jgi:poly(3-hydroxybutyrate) depolymerase